MARKSIRTTTRAAGAKSARRSAKSGHFTTVKHSGGKTATTVTKVVEYVTPLDKPEKRDKKDRDKDLKLLDTVRELRAGLKSDAQTLKGKGL